MNPPTPPPATPPDREPAVNVESPVPDALSPDPNTTGPHQSPAKIMPETNTTGPHQHE